MKKLILSITFFAITFLSIAQILETKNVQLGAQMSTFPSFYSIKLQKEISFANVQEHLDSLNFCYAVTYLNPFDEKSGLAHKLISISERSSEGLTKHTSGGVDTYFASSNIDYATVSEEKIKTIQKSFDGKIIIELGKTYEFISQSSQGFIQITSINGDMSKFQSDIIFNIKYMSIDCNGDINGNAYIDACDVCVGGNTELVTTCEVVNIPDNNFLKQLISLGIDKNNDGEIQVKEAELVTDLSKLGWDIDDFTGIEKFINLEKLACGGSATRILTKPEIDLSKNIKLIYLFCSYRNMTSLDLSNQTNLKTLDCRYNDSLKTVCVPSISDAEKNGNFKKDANTNWSESCGQGNVVINVTDNNFLNTLVSLGIDKNNDNKIQLHEISSVKTLTLSHQNISDLTGIENFTNLDSLIADNNLLKSLDITILNDLVYLNVDNNLLEILTINNLPLRKKQRIQNSTSSLTYLSCTNNKLTKLDVSQCNNLNYLDCSQNSTLPIIYVSSVDKANNQFIKDNEAEWKERNINGISTHYSENSIVIKAYNLQGKEVSINTKNELIILLHNNGKTEKVFQK